MNSYITGTPEDRKKGRKLTSRNNSLKLQFPNLGRDTDIQKYQVQRTPSKIRPESIPRHIIVKILKNKDKESILKAARKKRIITYKGTPLRLSAHFSADTLQARREKT